MSVYWDTSCLLIDGLHLATALHAGCRTVATTDQRMKTAAPLLGLSLL